MAAFLSLALLSLLTGGLHEDGLADSADGLFGGKDRDHALTIMKDSRIGSYGVIALVVSFGLRASALAALGALGSTWLAPAALLGAAAFSRALMIWHWSHLPPARSGGTAVAVGQPQPQARLLALCMGGALTLPLLACGVSPGALVLSLAVTTGAAMLFTRLAHNKINGHTGDTIGATQQITEMALLCALVITA